MADNTYTDIKKRAAALQIKALISVGDIEAYHYFMTRGTRYPYWTNRTGQSANGFNSEDYFDEERSIIMRLVIGSVTSGYLSELEDVLDGYIDNVYETFLDLNAQMLIDGTTYTEAPTYLQPLGTDLTGGDGGLAFFEAPWIEGTEVGVEFTLTVYLCREISKA